MELNKIKSKVLATKDQSPKKVKTVDGFREEVRVGRDDILEVLNHYANEKNERKNVKSFLDQFEMTEERKTKILVDLRSYPVNYKRKEGTWILS